LAQGYYQAYYQSWKAFNSSLTPDLRAGLSVNNAVPIITAPPTPASAVGIINAVWKGLSFLNWNQTTPIFHVVQTVLSTGSPIPPLPISLLESIFFQLGPSPSSASVKAFANAIVMTGTLSTYPLLPPDLVGRFVSPKNDTMLVVVDFSKAPETFGSAT